MSDQRPSRDDKDIMQDVERALLEDEIVSTDNIEIDIKNGKVILSGSVTSPEINHRIQDLVENTPGVNMVVNDMNVEIME